MKNSSCLLKNILLSIFEEQREKCEKSLLFYSVLEENLYENEAWKTQRESPFNKQLSPLIPANNLENTKILQTYINTIDEYRDAIENFSEPQFYAFVLGLGLNWLPINYWGKEELEDLLNKITKTIDFYDHILLRMPEEDHWKIKQTSFLSIS